MKQHLKKTVVTFLITLLMVPASLMIQPPKQADAQFECLLAALGAILGMNLLTAGQNVPTNDNTFNFTKCVLKPIGYIALNVLVDQIVADIVVWIQNGFEGAPGFATDPTGFLRDTGDLIAGEYILGIASSSGGRLPLDFLCSEFKLDIQVAMLLEYFQPDAQQFECRISDVIDNIDAFIEQGQMAATGWQGWFSINASPNNEPMASYIEARGKVKAIIKNKQGEQIDIWRWGQGWFQKLGVDLTAVTPASYNKSTGELYTQTPWKRVELADDFDEIAGALIGFFLNQLLGAAGLLGANGGGGAGGGGGQATAFNNARTSFITSANQLSAQAQAQGNAAAVAEIQNLITQAQALDPNNPASFGQLQQLQGLLNVIQSQLNGGGAGAGGGIPGGPGAGPGTTPPPPGSNPGGGTGSEAGVGPGTTPPPPGGNPGGGTGSEAGNPGSGAPGTGGPGTTPGFPPIPPGSGTGGGIGTAPAPVPAPPPTL